MKKIIICFAAFLTISLMFSSCEKEVDESLIVGRWQLVGGTEIYKYSSNGTGAFWDPADDVTEDEAQPFTWTLVKTELTHIHIIEMGGNVTKIYTVTELTSTSLKYTDDFDNAYAYTKI